uniref:sodium-independent anion transporter n=1 Tax=Kroppenstedtia sanguinis TaxID=1380684 RepID=UPI003D249D82
MPPVIHLHYRGTPLFFGAADRFERTLTRSIHHRPKVLLLCMRLVSLIDATGEAHLSTLVSDFQQREGWS